MPGTSKSTSFDDSVALPPTGMDRVQDVVDKIKVKTLLPLARTVVADKNAAPGGNGSWASPFDTVQAGVDYVSGLPLSSFEGAVVLIMPGTYAEDVVIRRSDVHLQGLGGQNVVIIKSVTITDCTLASIAAFNASGDPTVLVDAALPDRPKNNHLRAVTLNRQLNVPAWTGDAIASFRALGSPVEGNDFCGNELLSWQCNVVQAAGAAAGKGGLFTATANYISFQDCWVTGGIKGYQTAGIWLDFVTAVASPGGGTGTLEMTYDPALPEPSDTGNYGVNVNSGRVGKVLLSGPAGRAGQDYFEGVTIGEISIAATATAASASNFDNCHVKGAIDIAAVGPTITFNGGRYMVAISGIGAAGFTGNVGFNS